MSPNLKITLVQTDIIWNDIDKNLSWYESMLPKDFETDIIVLPEVFTTGFCADINQSYDTIGGKAVVWMQKISRKYSCAVTGSIVIKEADKFYNRLLWVDAEKIQYYNKRHLFSMGGEDKKYQHGTKRLIIEYKGWKICPLVCYDLRFPVWSRNNINYDLLLYVANWPKSRIDAWQKLLVARAVENQSYCVGVNRVGVDGKGFQYNGWSAMIDFKGNADWLETSKSVKTFEINLEELHKFRCDFPFWKDADSFELKD